jgi:hypothetical protein
LKSPIISTSMKNDFKPPRINTSKKHGGGGVQLQFQLQLATGELLPAGRPKVRRGKRRHPEEHAAGRTPKAASSPWRVRRGGDPSVLPGSRIRARRSAHPTRQPILRKRSSIGSLGTRERRCASERAK